MSRSRDFRSRQPQVVLVSPVALGHNKCLARHLSQPLVNPRASVKQEVRADLANNQLLVEDFHLLLRRVPLRLAEEELHLVAAQTNFLVPVLRKNDYKTDYRYAFFLFASSIYTESLNEARGTNLQPNWLSRENPAQNQLE